jgi:hypothetical protein
MREAVGTDAALSVWEQLPEDLKQSNLQQADDIAYKLRRIGCTIAVADVPGRSPSLTHDEIEHLAETEHGRWNAERLLGGWRWADRRDSAHRLSPYLVAWSDLPDDVREYDREAVRKIPELLTPEERKALGM